MLETGPVGYLLLFLAGFVAGTINVIAGGGSFLTLPLLIFMGLPAGVSNGTNRVGLLMQNLGAIGSFQKHGVIPWRIALWAGVPAAIGSLLGAALALSTPDATFQRILASLMAILTLWTLFDSRPRELSKSKVESSRTLLAGGFFLIGVYGGFVQAGVGFLILAVTTLAGLDLIRGNAVKVISVLAFTLFSLALFAGQGKVEWRLGLVLGAGTLLGGQVGVYLIVLKGHTWIKRVVTLMILLFAVKLWLG